MAKAGGPTTEQLLELLKRAAAELTSARDEAAKFQKELQGERKLREEAEGALSKERTVGGVKPKMRQQIEEVQELYQQSKINLDHTHNELLRSRENLVNEVAAQREIKAALERESISHGQTRAALEAEQNSHLQTQAALEQERNSEVKSLLVFEQQRVAELSEQLATVTAERDTLAARLDSLEAARKTDREIEDAKLKDLDDKYASDLAREKQATLEAQTLANQEKDKHQATAQKYLTEKQKSREQESELQELKARVGELESATIAAAEAHAKELNEREEVWRTTEVQFAQAQERLSAEHAQTLAALQDQLVPMQQQVEVTVQERFYVERKYEELSKELQLTLEQRDEARRILENVQAERQRLERALQNRTS
jgi:hypothetical protein